MRVERITIQDYKCFLGERTFFFPENFTYLIGPNGSGKTTVLNLIARLAGTDWATSLCNFGYGYGEEFTKIEIELSHGGKSYVLTLRDTFDIDAVKEFKASLPTRVSYPFGPDWGLWPHAICNVDAERASRKLIELREFFGPVEFRIKAKTIAPVKTLSSTSAHYWMLRMSRRLSVSETPMIFDDMPHNLDYGKQGKLRKFLDEGGDQQIICSTHSPEFLASHRTRSEIVSL